MDGIILALDFTEIYPGFLRPNFWGVTLSLGGGQGHCVSRLHSCSGQPKGSRNLENFLLSLKISG